MSYPESLCYADHAHGDHHQSHHAALSLIMQVHGVAAAVISKFNKSAPKPESPGAHTAKKAATLKLPGLQSVDSAAVSLPLASASAPTLAALPQSADSLPPLKPTTTSESPLHHFLPRSDAAASPQTHLLQASRDLSARLAASACVTPRRGAGRA